MLISRFSTARTGFLPRSSRKYCRAFDPLRRSRRPPRLVKRQCKQSAEEEGFCPVPEDQVPINELKELQDILFFDWATLPFSEFLKRLITLWTGFCLISFPVSAATFDPKSEPVPFFIAGTCGSLFVVMVVVFRLLLGWSHVNERLFSETVEYEESGWYDGQIWTKTPEILDRDRLASRFTVRPAVERLKTTLLAVSGTFVTCLAVLSFFPTPPPPTTIHSGIYTRAAEEPDDYWERVKKFEPWLFDDDIPQTHHIE